MIWITGASGMLGHDAALLLEKNGHDVLKSDREASIASIGGLREFIGEMPVEWIINCAAFTAVDRAETEPDAAFAVNAEGIGNLARIASEKNAVIIHISTDYVFDGKKGAPYVEEDEPNPLSVYGKSKLEGERLLKSLCYRYFIIRTSGLYGLNGNNFVNTMLALFAKQKKVRVVDDQKGSPTYTKDLAEMISRLISADNHEYGIYNFSNKGCITWHEFAEEIYREARTAGIISNDVHIEPISTQEFPLPAKRPEKSCLSVEKTEKTFGIGAPYWRESLRRYIVRERKPEKFFMKL